MIELERKRKITLLSTFVASIVVVGLIVLLVKLTPENACDNSSVNKLLLYDISSNQTGYSPLWFTNAQNRASVLGQDGGNSIPLENNFSWLIFGDTIPRSAGSWRSNSGMLLQTDGYGKVIEANFVVGEDGVVAQLLPFQGNETISNTAIWTGSGVYALNHTWMFYSVIDRNGKNPDFSGLAVAKGVTSDFVRYDFPDLLSGFTPMQLLIENGDDINNPSTFLYMYLLTKGFFEFYVHIARVPLSALLDLDSFNEKIQWYFENSWSSLDPNATIALSQSQIISSGVGAQLTVFWNIYLQSYTMLLAPVFSSSIEMSVSSNPYGPWSCNTLLFNAPISKQESIYCPYLHPELQSKDSPYVSLSYNIAGSTEIQSPLFAQVRFTPKS